MTVQASDKIGAKGMAMKFKRAIDEVLRENGWDPQWIAIDPDQEGPYAVVRIKNASCANCGGEVSGWSVVNLITATGVATEWTHADGEVEAKEHAGALNAAWLGGYSSGTEAAADHIELVGHYGSKQTAEYIRRSL